ncbi:hypothetical protein HDU98_000960 [Podochytrium sp. JEL0797]|nr:hypothetical protein HDU98_000960 [Podochytrium sp. JEL0797]
MLNRNDSECTDTPIIAESVAAKWKPTDAEGSTRRYHGAKESAYVLPNDVEEGNRLELQNTMLAMALGDNIVCPQAKQTLQMPGAKLLEVGCANGAWMESLYMQDGVRECEYHGVDISEASLPNQTMYKGQFRVANVLDRLPYEDNTFDFVHMRLLIAAFPKDKWVPAIQELLRVTKRGGWVELCEAEVLFSNEGPASNEVTRAYANGLEGRGLDSMAGANLRNYLVAAGGEHVANVNHKIAAIPIGWNGHLGELAREDWKGVFEGLADWLHKVLGIERNAWLEMVDQAAEEWGETKTVSNWTAAWAQKV